MVCHGMEEGRTGSCTSWLWLASFDLAWLALTCKVVGCLVVLGIPPLVVISITFCGSVTIAPTISMNIRRSHQ